MIRDGDDLPDEMFYDLDEPEAILYEEEWRRDWPEYRSKQTTKWALSSSAKFFPNVKTVRFQAGYVEAQNRNASDELPGGAASSLWEAFEVPRSVDNIRAIYGENQWKHRSLNIVFATPDGSDNLWHDCSRELFWGMVRSVQSARGRTKPLKVEFETVHNRVFWEAPASTMLPANNLVTEVEIRFLGSVDLRYDFGIVERYPQMFTNLEVLSVTAAANTWREDPMWVSPDSWYNGDWDRSIPDTPSPPYLTVEQGWVRRRIYLVDCSATSPEIPGHSGSILY
jgi:hypothetical protein